MSRSEEFVLSRIEQGGIMLPISDVDVIETSNIDILPFWDALKGCINIDEEFLKSSHDNNLMAISLKSDLGERTCRVKYDPEGDFEYCATEHSKYDGTLLFAVEMISRLLTRIITGDTYNSNTAPIDYAENPFNYDVNFIAGDVIIRSDFGRMNINGRMMAGQSDIACLPLSVEYIKRED